MEYLGEKVAYLKGLAEGLKISEGTDEGKLLLAIVDVLDHVTDSVSDLQSDLEDLSDLADELDEDLACVEEDIYGCDDDECDCDCCGDDDLDFYEVECPNCNEKIYLDEEMLENDEDIVCPNCKEHIEIELSDDDCGCGDGCGCGE